MGAACPPAHCLLVYLQLRDPAVPRAKDGAPPTRSLPRQWREGAGAHEAAEGVKIFTTLAWVRKEAPTFQFYGSFTCISPRGVGRKEACKAPGPTYRLALTCSRTGQGAF